MNGPRTFLIIFVSFSMLLQGVVIFGEGADDPMSSDISREIVQEFILEPGVEIPSTDTIRTNKSYFYPVPDGATILSASMDVSVQPFTEDGQDYPWNTWFNIAEGQREYQFKNEETSYQGSWGRNYQTIDGSLRRSFVGDVTLTFAMPLNATVKSATFNITGLQRDQQIIEMNLTTGASGNRFGSVIRNLGDVNNDKDDEILVSAPGESLAKGVVYFINSSIVTDNITHTRFYGASQVGAQFGTAISGIFEYNDNSRDAVAIGAPFDGIDNKGSVTTFTFDAKQSGFADMSIKGNTTGGEFGSSIDAADFNDDGEDELFVGAPNDNGGNGAVYIYSVTSSGGELITVINGSASHPGFGKQIAVGDMNDDGIDDVMIASDDLINLYLGSEGIDIVSDQEYDPITDSGSSATEIGQIRFLGRTLSATTTFGVGVPTATSGSVVLYDSSKSPDPVDRAIITPSLATPNFGTSIASGDMDDDGTNEIGVGAPGTSSSIGSVNIYKRGGAGPWKGMPVKGSNGDQFGYALEIADSIINGDDDFDDVIVGAPQYYGSSGTGSGIVYRYDYYDLATLTNNKPSVKVEGATAWAYSENRLNGEVTSGDVSASMNSFIPTLDVIYTSAHESFVWINITVESAATNNHEESASFIVNGYEIIYEQTISMPDLSGEFNHYMMDENRKKDTMDGNTVVLVPIAFSSQSPGKIRIDSIDVEYDEIPYFKEEPGDIHILEDSFNENVLDLYTLVEDETGNPYLKYSVSKAGKNASIPDVHLRDNRYLVIDMTDTVDENGDGLGDYLNWTGQFEIFFTITDEYEGKFISNPITVFVDGVNDPPAVTNLPNSLVVQDQVFAYSPGARDDENDDINYTLDYSNTPANMTIDHDLGTISWRPNMWEVGNTNFTLVLRDGTDERRYIFPLLVQDEPDTPVFLTPPPEAPDGVLVQTTFTYTFIAADPDIGDRVTFSIINAPQGAGIDSQTGEFTWTPPQHYQDPVEFRIRALDREGGTTDLIFTLNTTFLDTIPELVTEPSTELRDSVPWSFTIDIYDEEDHGIILEIVEKPEGMEYDEITLNLSWTPDVDQVGEFNLSLKIRSTQFEFYLNYTLKVSRSDREWTFSLFGLEPGETIKGKVDIGGDLTVSPSMIREVQIKIGDNNWTTGSVADGRWSYKLDSTDYEDGDYTIQIRGYDGAEYSDIESISISIKNEKEETSPLIFIIIAIIILILIGAGIGIFFLIKKQKEKKEKEELEKRQQEAIAQSKKSMNEFLTETGSDLDENIDYTQMEVHDPSLESEDLDHIDEIFQPLNVPKNIDDGVIDDVPEDPLANAQASTGPLMGESMQMEIVEEPVSDSKMIQEPPIPPEA